VAKYYHPQRDFYNKFKMTPPSTVSHGTEDNVLERMTKLKPTDWRMEGPGKLVAQTELGKLVQFVNPNLICKGTDEDGSPILAKIGV